MRSKGTSCDSPSLIFSLNACKEGGGHSDSRRPDKETFNGAAASLESRFS
jgi:hypothetical protein